MNHLPASTVSLHRALLGLSALALATCVGTPLPEPPDELPKPDFGRFARDAVLPTNFPAQPVLTLSAGPGAVQPNSEVWIINLDSAAPPVQARADATGGFTASALPALGSERVRVIARSERQHSAPLDLQTVMLEADNPQLDAAPLAADSLRCLAIAPEATLSLRSARGTLRLDNQCEVALDLTRVALRFGDQGFSLSSPPARLEAGQQVTLTVQDERARAPSERLEIVLIDAAASDGRSARYAIDVFSALD